MNNDELTAQLRDLTKWVSKIASTSEAYTVEHAGWLLANQILMGTILNCVAMMTGDRDKFIRDVEDQVEKTLRENVVLHGSMTVDTGHLYGREAKEKLDLFFKGFNHRP